MQDQMTLVASGGMKTSMPATLIINILPVNDEMPVLVNNTGLEVWAGATSPITNRHLGKINAHLGAQYTRLLNIRLLSFLRTTTSHYAYTMGPMTF